MARWHFVVTSVSLVLASTLTAVAADDAAVLERAKAIFKPLPNDVEMRAIAGTELRLLAVECLHAV